MTMTAASLNGRAQTGGVTDEDIDPAAKPTRRTFSAEYKAEIVADDEKETAATGGRALLNLGHTFAHAIENVAGYGQYLHGEAVAIGLNLATQLSVELGQIDASDIARANALIKKCALTTSLKAPLPISGLMAAMQRDNQNRNERLRFISLQTFGHAVTTDEIDVALVEALWKKVGAE